MTKRSLSIRLRIGFTLVCVLISLLIAEGVVRFLLFHPSERARNWGGDLRNASLFADAYVEDQFWRLRWRLDPKAEQHAPRHHPLLGWISRGNVDDGAYHLRDYASRPQGERPILLYGASYAQCHTGKQDCFQSIIEGSRLGPTHELYNHGVGGYGIDQVYMLLRESIDHYASDDPVVVIGAVADSDYERASMAFRIWPKPRLKSAEGRLEQVDTIPERCEQYLAEHGTGIRSYAWRGLLHSAEQLPVSWRDALAGGPSKRREQEELIEAIVLAMRDELDARGVDYFFLLFHSPFFMRGNESRPTLMTRGRPPPAVFLTELFERHGLPYIDTKPYILRSEIGVKGTYYPPGPNKNHPTPAGNLVLLEALCDGVERFGAAGR